MKNKGQQPRSFVWVHEQNEVEQADQVNVVFIKDEDDAQFFELLCQESPKHQRVTTIDSEMCGEVQVQDDSPECPKENSLPIEQKPY